MPTDYYQLLDATLQHLQDRKKRGVRYVNVSEETLAILRQPARTTSVPVTAQAAVVPVPPPASSLRPAVVAPVATGADKTKASGLVSDETPPAPSRVVSPPALPSTPAAPLPSAKGPADKAHAMAELRSRVLACQRCPHLASTRKNVVFGVGDINASLMFVGEAPGADEDAQGEPFVGAAGQLLTRIIQTMGLSRQTVFIANILKCRPDTPGQSFGNRAPTDEEMQTCLPHLLEQIDLIRPKVLVALGATAVKGLLHSKIGITKLRGTWQVFQGIPTMPTYHPAYLLRNQAMSEKRKVWEDMLQVMEKLGLPISDKQRNFFLKA